MLAHIVQQLELWQRSSSSNRVSVSDSDDLGVHVALQLPNSLSYLHLGLLGPGVYG